jgi:prepilin signal peptidase PulO-like enzyme (type II secretory pathway)
MTMPAPLAAPLLAEPLATGLLLAVFGALLAVSALFSRATQRLAVPVALVFLAIGMLAGSEGIGGIAFADYGFAFRVGTVALVLILFDGGLNTPFAAVRQAARPAGVLATVGVAGTAGLVAAAAHALGFAWPQALLLGAVVSSTDAAAVFAVLRGSEIHLKRRVGTTLEVESGINDPIAFILMVEMTRHLLGPGAVSGWHVARDLVLQVAVGGACGAAVGYGGRLLLARVRLAAGGLYPAFTLGLACLAYGVPTLARRQWVPGRVRGRGVAGERAAPLPPRPAARARRARVAEPDRDVPRARLARLPVAGAGGGGRGAGAGAVPGRRGAPRGGGRVPGAVPGVPAARGGLRGVGGAARRRADHPRHVPGAGRGARGAAGVRRRLHRRRGQRAAPGGDGAVAHAAPGAGERRAAGAAGRAGDREPAAARRGAALVPRGRGAGRGGPGAARPAVPGGLVGGARDPRAGAGRGAGATRS